MTSYTFVTQNLQSKGGLVVIKWHFYVSAIGMNTYYIINV